MLDCGASAGVTMCNKGTWSITSARWLTETLANKKSRTDGYKSPLLIILSECSLFDLVDGWNKYGKVWNQTEQKCVRTSEPSVVYVCLCKSLLSHDKATSLRDNTAGSRPQSTQIRVVFTNASLLRSSAVLWKEAIVWCSADGCMIIKWGSWESQAYKLCARDKLQWLEEQKDRWSCGPTQR